MATGNRPERVANLIKQEIATLLSRGLKDPRIGMATVSDVKLTRDLKSAKVYVQVIGTDAERAAAVKGLSSAAGFIRHELRERLSLRTVPELTFHPDETAARADHIMGLLSQIRRGEETREEGATADEADPGESEAAADESE